jgi:N-acetylmuramoyl-L-alanine amidase
MKKFNFYILKYVFILSIPILLNGCTSAAYKPKVSKKTIIQRPTIYLTNLCNQYHLNCQWDNIGHVVYATINDVPIRILIGSKIVLVNQQEVVLSKSIVMKDSLVVLPQDFKEKVITPFDIKQVRRREVQYPLLGIRQVIIDAGHGGKDPGAISRKGLQEKEVNLDVAKRVRKILEKNRIKVIMTRDTDNFISLSKRTEIASKTKAGLFVSIHANSNPHKNVQGIEIYTSKKLNRFDKVEEQKQKNITFLFKNFNMDQRKKEVGNIVLDMIAINKQPESNVLASSVATELSRLTKARYLGNKQSRFFVLRNTLIPAILVEVGFLSNYKEEKLLQTSLYRQKIAEGIAKGILAYVKR